MKSKAKRGLLAYVSYFIAAISLGALVYFAISYFQSRDKVIEQINSDYMDVEYAHMKEKLEKSFGYMYESARTISLLPSVREIEGGNCTEAGQDVVEMGRFSEDAHITVQQLYNNLAANVAVSEVYIITEGLDASKGEVPFLMYDQLIVQKPKVETAEEEGPVNPDYPEESEEAEYELYPKQIAGLKAKYPTFNFDEITKIPAAFSESIRTCDNTQFPSIANSNELDSYGICYSVPFYSTTGEFRGIISAIFRDNIVEAELLNVPFLIITDDDIKAAQEMGFEMPEKFGNFYLTNETYGVEIYDRRNATLPGMFASEPESTVSFDLDVHGDSVWKLGYYFDKSMFADALSALLFKHVAYMILIALVAGMLIGLLYYYRVSQIKMIDRFAKSIKEVSSGNLNASIDATGEGFDSLKHEYNHLTGSMHSMIGDIKNVSDTVYISCNDINSLLEVLSNSSRSLSDSTDSVMTQVVRLTQMSTEVTSSMDSVQLQVDDASKRSKASTNLLGSVTKSMNDINSHIEKTTAAARELEINSTKISELVSLIDNIAMQTNILSLNASVESSRVGKQHGAGFKIVSTEMKTLADQTSSTVKNITEIIENIQKQIGTTITLMSETKIEVQNGVALSSEANENVKQITELVSQLEVNAREITKALDTQHSAVESINQSGDTVAHNVKTNNDSIEEVNQIAETLRDLSGKLKESISVFKI